MNTHQERLSKQISLADAEILDITAQREALLAEIDMINQRVTFLNARQNNWVAQRLTWQTELARPVVSGCTELVPLPRTADVVNLDAHRKPHAS